MKAKQLLTTILFLAILISCNKLKKENTLADSQSMELKTDQEQQKPGGYLQGPATDSLVEPPVGKQVSSPNWDKKIIKTATLKLEVPDFKKYNESVRNTIKQYGGYIAQEEQALSEDRSENTISIKVPVAQFESMMNQLPGSDVKVLERKITTDDVTGEVIDIKSRLEAKKQMRLKYLDFLKQSKNMAESLQVQEEINSIQEEIEAAASRVNFLSNQASFSTINLTFYQPLPGFKPVDKEPGFLTRLSIAFKSGVSWFADIFIGIMSVWPFVLLVAIALIAWKRSKAAKPIHQNA